MVESCGEKGRFTVGPDEATIPPGESHPENDKLTPELARQLRLHTNSKE
jgi:hypothetical protein